MGRLTDAAGCAAWRKATQVGNSGCLLHTCLPRTRCGARNASHSRLPDTTPCPTVRKLRHREVQKFVQGHRAAEYKPVNSHRRVTH